MSTCGCPLMTTDVNLVPGSDKQPDGHWRIDPTRLQNPPPPGTIAINLATNLSVGNGPLRSGFKVNAGAGFFNFPLHRTGGFRCDRGNRNGNAPELLIKILNTHRSMNISGLHRNGAIYGRRRRITPEFQKEPETRDCIELRL